MESSNGVQPKILRLRGEEIRCIDALPPGLLFDLSDLTGETDVLKTVAMIGRFLKAIVVPEDQERFRQIIYDPVNVLSITELSDAAGTMIQGYAQRPTLRPSDSPDGSPPTGEVSKVVSLSQGTVRLVDPSLRDGQSPES